MAPNIFPYIFFRSLVRGAGFKHQLGSGADLGCQTGPESNCLVFAEAHEATLLATMAPLQAKNNLT